MKKKNYILIIIGFLLCIVPYFINFYSVYRLISVIIGIIILSVGLILNTNKKRLKAFIYPILLVALFSVIDLGLAKITKYIPMISIKISSSDKVNVYNAFFYRVFDCNGKLTVDDGYQANYLCNIDDIDVISVNKFLENPKESFKNYYGKFVHLKGKIKEIKGDSTITLASYTGEIELNGYVLFDDNKKVVLNNLNIDPNDYYIYDEIDLVGEVVSYIETDDILTINIDNIVLNDNKLYSEYELIVNNIDDKEKFQVEEGIYYLGLEGIYYKYDENNIYKLTYLLKDTRESIDNLTKDITPSIINENDNLYELEKYNIIVCENKDIIFANKSIKKYKEICD